MNFHSFFIILSIICFPVFTWAVDSYSSDELVQLTLNRNPELKARQFEVEALKAKIDQAAYWEDPVLELGIDKQDTAAGTTNFSRLGISQMLPRPGRLRARSEAAVASLRAQELTKEHSALELKAQLLELILSYKVALAKVEHAKERVQRFQTVETFLSSRPFAAPQKKAEATIVRSKLLVLEKELRDQEAKRRMTWNALNMYLGLATEPNLRVDWLRKAPPLDLQGLQHKAEAQSLSLKVQRAQVIVHGSEVRLAQYDSWPGLMLSAGFANGSGAEPEKDYSLGLAFAIPLLNGNRGTIAAAAAQESSARQRLTWEQEKLKADLQSSFEQYASRAVSLQSLSVDLIPQMEKEMAAIDSAFKKGQVDLITYLEADAQHFAGLAAILDTQSEFLESQDHLLILAGEEPHLAEK